VDPLFGTELGNLFRLSSARSRSLSAENPTGAPGAGGLAADGYGAAFGGQLGPGWKVSPAIVAPAGTSVVLGDVEGPGAIQQIWLTTSGDPRLLLLRVHWDGQEQPSVLCPVADFFASGWGTFAQISSLAVCVNPVRGFNCYWRMPFRRSCRITVENLSDRDAVVYYQVNYELAPVPPDAGYFHAQFRRSPRIPYGEVCTLLDGVSGRGHYVGTHLAWDARTPAWWGEGELKFFLDGEAAPTICGTGTEDYFGGAWCFRRDGGEYLTFTGPYTGMPLAVRRADGGGRFSLYRWHVADPIRFTVALRVTVQALGLRHGRYEHRDDDIASVAYWYQTLPTAAFPAAPVAAELAVPPS
jgi:Protein of unknown function (DUF2961)